MLLAGLLLALLVAPTSCSNDDDPDHPTPTTQPPEAEVEAAYLAYWEMADRLAEAPDPDDSELPNLATGSALAELRDGLTTLKDAGNRLEVGPKAAHTVSDVRLSGDRSATLRDCDVDDSRLLDSDGQVLDQGLTTTLWEVRLVRPESGWLVDQFTRLEAWEGEVDCQ